MDIRIHGYLDIEYTVQGVASLLLHGSSIDEDYS